MCVSVIIVVKQSSIVSNSMFFFRKFFLMYFEVVIKPYLYLYIYIYICEDVAKSGYISISTNLLHNIFIFMAKP